MMAAEVLLFIFGSVFIFFGYFYLSQPSKIFRLHGWLRETVLNDAYINLHRKRIASVLILIGLTLVALTVFQR